MKPLKIIVIALGSLAAIAGFGILVAGLFLGWAFGTQRDADGYFTTPTERFASEARAITSEDADILIDREAAEWLPSDLAEVRFRAEGVSGPVFIGIGPEDEVHDYLAGVSRSVVTNVDYGRRFDVDYRDIPGDAEPSPPSEQDFWVVQAAGDGVQTVEWELESGRWTVVLMNADGSPGVAAELSAGGQSSLLPVAIFVLLVLGILFLLGGAGLILLGAIGIRDSGAGAPTASGATAAPAGAIAGAEPVRIEGHLDASLSRWLWLVKWFFALPHFIVLFFLWVAFGVLTFFAGVAILFTGRYPRGIFDFNVGVLRWSWRVGFYATSAIGTDRYPPFSLGAEPDYPARLEVDYPERLSRGLVLVKWWLLAIPHYIILAIFTSSPSWALEDNRGWEASGPSLLTIAVVIAGIALLVRGRYPQGLFNLLMGVNRWIFRVIVYAALMTDDYPPFRLDQGGEEPRPGGVTPAAPAPLT
ncbi:MAG: DUF4389 domain-containing protein [Dehalococcoidia bacterium]